MPSFIQTLESLTAGPLAWTDADLVRVAAASILSKPSLTEDLALSDATFVPKVSIPTVAKTIVYTAPVDLTVRNLVFDSTAFEPLDSGAGLIWNDQSFNMLFGKITIAGTGPDVGDHVEGFGVYCGLFSVWNLLIAPRLNYRMAAGDTLSITVYNAAGSAIIPYNLVATYDTGIDTSVKPT